MPGAWPVRALGPAGDHDPDFQTFWQLEVSSLLSGQSHISGTGPCATNQMVIVNFSPDMDGSGHALGEGKLLDIQIFCFLTPVPGCALQGPCDSTAYSLVCKLHVFQALLEGTTCGWSCPRSALLPQVFPKHTAPAGALRSRNPFLPKRFK